MPKKIEDIVPSGRKSIRDIPVPVRRNVEPRKVESIETISPSRLTPEPVYNSTSPKSPTTKRRVFLSMVILICGGLAFYSLRSGATVEYTPKIVSLTFDKELYSASQMENGAGLSYSIVKLSKEKSLDVPASGEESVSISASGRVVIYNTQDSPQQLVATTRLESPDGKIYRIPDDITIPAKGNLEVTATADQPGVEYNTGLTDFTIPGFKGSSKYELVYARSKSSMSGGFIGMRKKVSEDDLANAKSVLEESIRSELMAEVGSQMPEGFVAFPEFSNITYEMLPTVPVGESNAKVGIRGDISSVIFNSEELSEYLATQKLNSSTPVGEIEVSDFSLLAMSPVGELEGATATSSIRFQVSGTADFVYITEEALLAADLSGTRKNDLETILEKYQSIETASATIRPFWKSSFPSDATKIKIEANK
ncbi:MAG: hypothetical protein ACYCY6_02195 [Minisyncoccota bacterium]